jgi:hypothetical protein
LCRRGNALTIVEVKDITTPIHDPVANLGAAKDTWIHFSNEIKPENALDGKLKKASKQLQSSGKKESKFKVAWFNIHGTDPASTRESMRYTLYGLKTVIFEHSSQIFECFFFEHSVFDKSRHMDACVLATYTAEHCNLSLHLNPLSCNSAEFRTCEFCNAFGRAIEAPSDEASGPSGGYLYLDWTRDVPDPKDKVGALARKYNIREPKLFPISRIGGYRILP